MIGRRSEKEMSWGAEMDDEEKQKPLMRFFKLHVVLLAIGAPPLAVFIMRGLGKQFLINIVLLLLFIPAMIHALCIAIKDIRHM